MSNLGQVFLCIADQAILPNNVDGFDCAVTFLDEVTESGEFSCSYSSIRKPVFDMCYNVDGKKTFVINSDVPIGIGKTEAECIKNFNTVIKASKPLYELYNYVFIYNLDLDRIELPPTGMRSICIYNPFILDSTNHANNSLDELVNGIITFCGKISPKKEVLTLSEHPLRALITAGVIHEDINDLEAIENLHDGICLKEYYKLTPKDKVNADIEGDHGTKVVILNGEYQKVKFATMNSDYVRGYLKELLANLRADEQLTQIRIYRELGTIFSQKELEDQLKDYKIPAEDLEFRNTGNPPYIDENGKHVEDKPNK